MTLDYKKIGRKVLALIISLVVYYIVHEGAHLIYALICGSFEKINFLLPGIQIQADTASMTDMQIGIFCLVGALSTLLLGYILCFLTKKIVTIKSDVIRAVFYYLTIVMLLNDTVYLSLLYGFFGGGDMNGISLILPEIAARIVFSVLALINVFIIYKFIAPEYKAAFCKMQKTKS